MNEDPTMADPMADPNPDTGSEERSVGPAASQDIDNEAAKMEPQESTRSQSESKSSKLFRLMAHQPWLFLAFLPILWIIFCSIGWTKGDKVEDEVNKIWIQQRSEYAKDKEYADSLGTNDLGSTAFFGLAASRDGDNMFTEDRLKELVARMQKTEATTIDFKGHTISWQDVCSSNSVGPGTAYQFPCARLTPIDFFQEARWFFREVDRVTWYEDVVRKVILKPRLERFGILQGVCSNVVNTASTRTDCNHVLLLRSSPAYAVQNGYPASYANPLNLFGDIGNLEMNDQCKICIETEFENTIDQLEAGIRGMYQITAAESGRAIQDATANNPNEPVDADLARLFENAKAISQSLTRQDVIDYFVYTTVRRLYAAFGSSSLVSSYSGLATDDFLAVCNAVLGSANCAANITEQEAQALLLNHADHAFSSWNSGGLPFPFWSEETADNPAVLFGGTSPVSGSGVDLSGNQLTTMLYFDAANYNPAAIGDTWNPLYADGSVVMDMNDPSFIASVETDPAYKWFIASVTSAEDKFCDNKDIGGSQLPQQVPNADAINAQTAGLMQAVSPRWCTKFSLPNADTVETDTTEYTVQHFARMWYDLVIDSPSFLGLTQGTSDPYVWTTGQGCGYSLGGERAFFTDVTDDDVLLRNASGQLYYIDEGSSLGPVDRNLLLGGTEPSTSEYSPENPLKTASVLSSIYVKLVPRDIVQRVANCNRPDGPIEITEAEAEDILYDYKKAFEESWTEDWDDSSAGEVKFVGFHDDQGVIGTTGRLLKDITLDNGTLVAISIVLLALFSALFLLDCDLVESRILITTVGVALVILAFFASVGFGLMCGIKVNITIGWTLPFIMLGLGVDDMYIVLIALKKQGGYTEANFLAAMKEVLVPVSMTSMVNAAMFAILNISDVPAVYLTARVALIAVVFLYLTIILCFPAYCWLDMQRQAANRYDVACCVRASADEEQDEYGDDDDKKDEDKEGGSNARGEHAANKRPGHVWASFIYDDFYRPVLLGESAAMRAFSHTLVWVTAATLIGLAIWGITEREIGLGLEDFFPDGNQAKEWATIRTAELASWSVGINWGELDYSNMDVQMQMVKQFEDVVESPHVAQLDTDMLWMADLQIWASRHCTDNFDREDTLQKECGRDQIYPKDNSSCSATWLLNTIGRRNKQFPVGEQCVVYKGGICRPTEWMHPDDLIDIGETYQGDQDTRSWCPVLDNWDDEKMQFCIGRWRDLTGGGGKLLLHNDTGTPRQCSGEYRNDELVQIPIKFSQGPSMFVFGLNSHDDTLDLLDETRAFCDDHPELRCWMTGIPYDYWSQYIGIFGMLLELGAAAVGIGFAVSFLFLFLKLSLEANHPRNKIMFGSFVGALLISVVTLASLVTVSGLSFLSDVSLTGFSQMSFVLSVGFAVEYAVHVVSRWLRSDLSIEGGIARVEYTMSFLMLPTFMSFVSSVIGISCLAFTDFEFNEVFFFRPLMIVVMVTYFFGCWWLPCILALLDCDSLRLGRRRGAAVTADGPPTASEDVAAAKTNPDAVDNNDDEIPSTKYLNNDNSSSEEDFVDGVAKQS
eukprot:CAMPEP_0198134658 /NCGR_PEP_ID=MMETSP1442-20131203/60188_1 /TAXON_ID= /ORGANISM="Craspedostauros australis, Strain CCMP3328" /LENGTH=1556 /DNA_ID=CAMNT_0043795805 /DNA_START=403 /DNA_END=5073 /DNA_ORIENTATION=+